MESITLSQNFQVVMQETFWNNYIYKLGNNCQAANGSIRLIPENDIQAFRGILKGANPENYRVRA